MELSSKFYPVELNVSFLPLVTFYTVCQMSLNDSNDSLEMMLQHSDTGHGLQMAFFTISGKNKVTWVLITHVHEREWQGMTAMSLCGSCSYDCYWTGKWGPVLQPPVSFHCLLVLVPEMLGMPVSELSIMPFGSSLKSLITLLENRIPSQHLVSFLFLILVVLVRFWKVYDMNLS